MPEADADPTSPPASGDLAVPGRSTAAGLDGTVAPASTPVTGLARTVERLVALSAAREASGPVSSDARERARRLHDHLLGHILPRTRSLEAPLLVLLLGPTGAGKSSLLNALARRPVSPAGVLRPTTRRLVLLARPGEAAPLLEAGGALASIEAERRQVVEDRDAPSGIALVDAPDVDSIERANRALTDRLTEAADLAVFVTTATRYADRMPWDVLDRAHERGLPMVIVVNRLPPDRDQAAEVLRDVRRLMTEAGLDALAIDAPGSPPDHRRGGPSLEILGVPEGALDPSHDGLDPSRLGPLTTRLEALGRDRDARRALAARSLVGSLGGLRGLVERIADDAEHEAIDGDALRRAARHAYEAELSTLRDELARGAFLRAEALRQWHEFVGADQITRFFASGLERLRGTLAAVLQGTPTAPIAEVRGDTIDDLVAVAGAHLATAARRTATAWSGEPRARDLIADRPGLWSASPDLPARLGPRIEAWMGSIAEDVRTHGAGKRRIARGASIGVNVAGVGVMLATFAQTGGITGAEMGLAAATAFLNQKLLEALFGDAALVEMVSRARRGLASLMSATFDEELDRYLVLVPEGEGLRELGAQLRAAATELGTAPAAASPAAASPVAPRLSGHASAAVAPDR